METQAWHLKRLLSFTKNRLANRPHRPRDPVLRDFLCSIGFEWPEPEQSGDGEGGDESDGDGSSSDVSDSSDDSEDEDTTPPTQPLEGTLTTYVFHPTVV